MWRSVRRASPSLRRRQALVPVLSTPPQVLSYHNLTSLQSQSPLHFSTTVVSPNPSSIHQTLRFFSNDSLDVQEISSSEDIQVVNGEEENEQVSEIDLDQLESVLSLLQSSNTPMDDGSLQSTLQNMGLKLHDDFIVKVLETPLVPGENLIHFFKWSFNNPDISITSRAVHALVRAICSGKIKKEVYVLWDLVQEIGEKENHVLNTEILNELLSLFSKLGKGKVGFDLFNKFEEFGCVPDAETYYYTVKALCKRSIYHWACSVCEKMLSAGKLPDSERVGGIITYLCKGRKAKDAHMVYLFAKENNLHPPQTSVDILISLLCRDDDNVSLAMEMLDDFSADERKCAIKPFSSVVSGLCRIKDVEGAKSLLFKMIDAGPLPGNAVFNEIINGLSKSGEMEEAKKMVDVMENRGLKPDVYTYSVIMSGYVRGGEMEAACNVLAEAKKKHKKLCPVTYHTLIRGYCKLEKYDQALKLLSEMKEFGVEPTTDEYNKLIQSLCLKALDWETSEKLLAEMKDNGLHLNGITEGLIRAVRAIEEEEAKREELTLEA